ncbi:hypothetical protein [Nostoc sp.]|uniref:hypothetical protein n=1 Tax=Nostoc sp. TaxID=1180 RepID=UPI002FF9569C
MSESTLFTTLSTNEEANLSGGGSKSHGDSKTIIVIGQVGGDTHGNSNTAIGGDANYYDYTKKPKGHH